jgi:peptide/nickel transport system substrate-binding protein
VERAASNPDLTPSSARRWHADAEKRKFDGRPRKIPQDSGIIIQPFWRSLYRHTALRAWSGKASDLELHMEKVWLDK